MFIPDDRYKCHNMVFIIVISNSTLQNKGNFYFSCTPYHPIINCSVVDQKRKYVLKMKNQRSSCTCTLNMVFDNAFQKPSTD